jgi:hypothetical protein
VVCFAEMSVRSKSYISDRLYIVRAAKGIAMLKMVVIILVVTVLVQPAYADLADKLDRLIGYTIIASKTIERWYDTDEQDESFIGCSHGRVIVFTDGTALTCAEYGYQYAYRPTAIILAKEYTYEGKVYVDYKMVVEDDIYDMRYR